MVANELTFAVLALVVLLAIAFFAVYRKTGTVTVGAIDLYLCLHNLKYIILLRLSPFFYYSSILFDTPPFLDNKLLAQIPHLSTKAILSAAARGVIVGIATDLAYKGGYIAGEYIWDNLFTDLYGETAYEYYAEEFDAFYSSVLNDLVVF